MSINLHPVWSLGLLLIWHFFLCRIFFYLSCKNFWCAPIPVQSGGGDTSVIECWPIASLKNQHGKDSHEQLLSQGDLLQNILSSTSPQSRCTPTKSPAEKVKTSYFGPASHLSAVAKEIKLHKLKLEYKDESSQAKKQKTKNKTFWYSARKQ